MLVIHHVKIPANVKMNYVYAAVSTGVQNVNINLIMNHNSVLTWNLQKILWKSNMIYTIARLFVMKITLIQMEQQKKWPIVLIPFGQKMVVPYG